MEELRCEYAENPLGVNTDKPRFSWKLQSNQRGQMQIAYQILVSSSQEKLSAGIGDKWNSGKVASEKSVNVPYAGSPLSSGEMCWWQVRCWDGDNHASEYSEPATFEMGLLNESDWEGEWIGMSPTTGLRFVKGQFGQAISLDGTRGTFQIPHYSEIKPDEEVTISAWVKPDKNTGSEQLNDWMDVCRNNDGVGCYRLALGTNNGIYGLLFGLSIDMSYLNTFASVDVSRLITTNASCMSPMMLREC